MCSLVRNLKHTAVQPQASQKVERHPLCEPLPIRAPSSLLEFCDNSFLAFFGVWVISKKLKFLYSKVKVKSLSRVRLFATPWTVAYQAPLSMGFSSQEYWSGFSPVDLPDPGMEPRSPALQTDALPSEPPGKSIVFSVDGYSILPYIYLCHQCLHCIPSSLLWSFFFLFLFFFTMVILLAKFISSKSSLFYLKIPSFSPHSWMEAAGCRIPDHSCVSGLAKVSPQPLGCCCCSWRHCCSVPVLAGICLFSFPHCCVYIGGCFSLQC